MIISAPFIILDKRPYRESGLMLGGITPDYGEVSYILHGGQSFSKSAPQADIFREVEIEFEEMSEVPFSLEALQKVKNTVALGLAAIKVAKPDTTITLDRLKEEATGPEITALNNAVIESMTEWLAIPKVVAKKEAEDMQPENGDEQQKN